MKKFNIHDWQAKQRRLSEQDDYQKRQDRLTPGKNPEEFYGSDFPNKAQESMSNADIRALQTVVGEYSLNKVLNTIAVIADRVGKHDEADMVKKLADKIQDFDSTEDNPINEQDDEDLRLEPEDDEYEDGTPFYDDDEDLTFEPEGGEYVDEIELDDLDFETLKASFPKFYQKVKFTRPQTGEPYYEDAISFPNLDDTMTVIGDSVALEDWKNIVRS